MRNESGHARMRRSEMPPKARGYSDNVYAQIREIYARAGVANAEELRTLSAQEIVRHERDLMRLPALLEQLAFALANPKRVEAGVQSEERAARCIAAGEALGKEAPLSEPVVLALAIGRADVAAARGDEEAALKILAALEHTYAVPRGRDYAELRRSLFAIADAYANFGDATAVRRVLARIGDDTGMNDRMLGACARASLARGRIADADAVLQGKKEKPLSFASVESALYVEYLLRDDKDAAERVKRRAGGLAGAVYSNFYVFAIRHCQKKNAHALALTFVDAMVSVSMNAGEARRQAMKELGHIGYGMKRAGEATHDLAKKLFRMALGGGGEQHDLRVDFFPACTAIRLADRHDGKELTYMLDVAAFWANKTEHGAERVWYLSDLARAAQSVQQSPDKHVSAIAAVRKEWEDERTEESLGMLSATAAPYIKALMACGRTPDAFRIADAVSFPFDRMTAYLALAEMSDDGAHTDVLRRCVIELKKTVAANAEQLFGRFDDHTRERLVDVYLAAEDEEAALAQALAMEDDDAAFGVCRSIIHELYARGVSVADPLDALKKRILGIAGVDNPVARYRDEAIADRDRFLARYGSLCAQVNEADRIAPLLREDEHQILSREAMVRQLFSDARWALREAQRQFGRATPADT